MMMIPQNTNEKQDILNNIFRDVPIVLADEGLHLYFLVKDLSEELEAFIFSGKKDRAEYQVFSEEDMREMAGYWEGLGLTVTYHSQRMEYMNNEIEIIYPRICDPETGMMISLIPWVMLPGRPYPIFLYLFAIWHYYSSEKKSMRLSAEAAGKLFGISSLNKSTISRNIKAMDRLFTIFQIDRPLSTESREAPSIKDIIRDIPKMLKECPSIEKLKEMYGDRAGQLPEQVNKTGNIPLALSGIPHEYAKVIKDNGEPIRSNPHDSRKRPARPRKQGKRATKRRSSFVESKEIEEIRKAFITKCRDIIIDAAVRYHQLLL